MTKLSDKIRQMHFDRPAFGATEIAYALDTNDAYVRAVAKRHSLKLPRSRRGSVPTYGAAWIAEKRRAALKAQP